MDPLTYHSTRLVVAGMLLVMGATLSLGVIPEKLRGSIFDSSRKCIGIAIMLMPISTLTSLYFAMTFHNRGINIVTYLTAFYTISIIVTVGFVPLLGRQINYRSRRFIRGIISIPFFALPLLLTTIYCSDSTREIIRAITIFVLVFTILYQSFILYKFYKKAIIKGNNYYSDDIEVDINWILKSVFAFFILEIVCAISAFNDKISITFGLLLITYRFLTVSYVFSQFVKFMKNFETKMSVCDENIQIEEPTIIANEDVYYKSLTNEQLSQIGKHLEIWINRKEYTRSGVTINDVATKVVTNRTYLSIYINTTYGCSFKAWVTSLRIERAKSLLLGDDTTIDIAKNVGFSSPQSFMHSFKRCEGCTPTEWRNINKKDSN